MNTVRCTMARRTSGVRMALLMFYGLCGLVLSLALLPASLTYAASARPDRPALTSTGVLEQAGVSVVRLVIRYSTVHNLTTACTALGTIIASWPSTTLAERNNWVLTDSSMVSLNGGSCSKGSQLAGVQIQANSTFTNQAPAQVNLGGLTCTKGLCRDQQLNSTGALEEVNTSPAAPGGVLFSFHTEGLNVQPYLNSGSSSTTGTGIELANQTNQWPQSFQLSTQPLQDFLTPVYASIAPTVAPTASLGTKITTPAPVKLEPGMPFVDTQGNLVGMQVSDQTAPLTTSQLISLESVAPELKNQATLSSLLSKNALEQNWNAGIQAYDQGSYKLAAQTLNKIQDPAVATNPDFKAAAHFAQLATSKEQQSGRGTPTPTSSNGQGNTSSVLGIPTSAILLVGLIAGVIFLALLLVLVSLVFGRRRAQRARDKTELARFKEEEDEARRAAEYEARRITEESHRKSKSLQSPQSPQSPQPQLPLLDGSEITQPIAPFHELPGVVGLPPLAPPAPPAPPAPSVMPNQAQAGFAPGTPGVSGVPLSSEDASLIDTPTVPARKNGNGVPGVPGHEGPIVRDLRNISLAVGFQSNVGIKRQHKPNEDSLFAMQGARTHNSQPQQFGLFVVADGMGGHANGQDASRLAIQTMIDFMLPRISVGNGMMDDAAYLRLLEEGVQHANQAVHHRNLEAHADMGTTMTTALVIGAMAYVANVGDSRTYLYRQSLGLTKVTRDHSVVASLVDAGIIKPDDIYTHPKRNQIYRSLGEKPIVEVDSFKVELLPNDKLLLCSDGLWDMVRDPEIQRIVSAPEPDPTRMGEDLIQAALKSGGEDNVSVIIVSIGESSGHTGLTGMQLLAKPESVTVPDLPAM